MTTQAIALIATHSLLRLCFHQDTERFACAQYIMQAQMRQAVELSHADLLGLIERYRTSDMSEIAEVMRA